MNYYIDDFVTFGLLILSFIIVLFAQVKIKINYKKYKKIDNHSNISGADVARMIIEKYNLNIYVVETSGELTDHYNSKRKVIKLSSDIYNGTSIASIAVAAHEVGHAIQDKFGYKFMRFRTLLVPIVNFISYAGYFGLIISIFAGITGYLKICLLAEFLTLLFQIITLPVEFDASSRAKKELVDLNLVTPDEKIGVSKMLRAAALTYVASLISIILNILRIISFIKNDD